MGALTIVPITWMAEVSWPVAIPRARAIIVGSSSWITNVSWRLDVFTTLNHAGCADAATMLTALNKHKRYVRFIRPLPRWSLVTGDGRERGRASKKTRGARHPGSNHTPK